MESGAKAKYDSFTVLSLINANVQKSTENENALLCICLPDYSSHSPHCSTPAWNPSSLSVLLSHCISWLLSTRPGLDEANSHPGHKTKGGPNAWGCAKAGSTLGVEVSSTFVPGDPCSPYPCPNSAYWPQNLGQSI